MRRQLLELYGFLRFLVRRFDEDRCVQIASSLAFTTLLSLVPLLVVALIAVSAFPAFADLISRFKMFVVTHMVPEVAGTIITVYMQQFSEQAAHLTAVGIAALAATAVMLMLTIEHAFNLIWRVHTPRPLVQRILTYWAGLTLGPLLLGASLSLTSYLVSYSLGYVSFIPDLGVAMLKVAPVAMTTLAFTLLYLFVPNCYVPLKHALAGGAVVGVGLALMNKAFTAYILHFSSYTLVYGAFASLPVFLSWIYFSWLVILAGAVVAASLSYWRGGVWRAQPSAGRRYFDAIRVLRALCREQRQGEASSLPLLRRRTHLALDEIEEILRRLHGAKWAVRTASGAWALSRKPADVLLADVFRLFVFAPEKGAGDDEALKEQAARAASWLEQGFAGTLEDLCAAREQEVPAIVEADY